MVTSSLALGFVISSFFVNLEAWLAEFWVSQGEGMYILYEQTNNLLILWDFIPIRASAQKGNQLPKGKNDQRLPCPAVLGG